MSETAKKLLIKLASNRTYLQRMKALYGTDLKAFVPMDELTGTNAEDKIGGRDGTFVSVTVGQSNPPFVTPSFDGTNGYVNLNSLVPIVDGSAFGVWAWVKISAATYADGSQDYILEIGDALNNRIATFKSGTANRVEFRYVAGGTAKSWYVNGITSTGWQCILLTGSAASDTAIAYINGVQAGATQSSLGVWAAESQFLFGAYTTGLLVPLNGYGGNVGYVDRLITPAEALRTYQYART